MTGEASLRRWARASVAAIALGWTGEALAQAPAQDRTAAQAMHDFNVPAGALAQTGATFSEQAGVQLIIDAGVVRDLRSGAVSGRMSIAEGLSRLLAGTGLSWRWLNASTVTIEAQQQGARALGPVRVEGAQYQGPPQRGEGVARLGGVRGEQDEEARGLRPVVASVGAGAPTALEDIPRSISVLTQEQIQKQDIQTFGDALKRLPGVTNIEDFTPLAGSQIVSRGFVLQTFQIDGGAPRAINAASIIGNGQLDINAYERVELVRGSNGTLVGADSPGGTINLVRKRPGSQEKLTVAGTVGSWDRYQGDIDYSTPSVLGSAIAFRGVASYDKQNFFYKDSDHEAASLYGIFDAPLGDAARLEAGFNYSKLKENGEYQGAPRYLDGPLIKLPYDFNQAPPWAFEDVQKIGWFSRFYINLGDDWSMDFGGAWDTSDLKAITWQANPKLYSLTDATYPGLTPATPIVRERHIKDSVNMALDFRISGKLKTWFLDHSLLVTGDYNEVTGNTSVEERTADAFFLSYPIRSTAELDPSRFPYPVFSPFSESEAFAGSSSSTGFALIDTISWKNRVDLTVGVRRTDTEGSSLQVSNSNQTGLVTGVSPPESFSSTGTTKRDDEWRPSWSLAIKPVKGLTFYGSHSEGSRYQGNSFTPSGKRLDPAIYENLEWGVKYGAEGWLASVSGYNLDQTNVAVAIPGSQGQCPPFVTSSCFYEGGANIKSKGYDFELTGEVLDGLSAQLSYNYNTSVTVSSQAPTFSQAPTHEAKLFLDWTPWFSHRLSMNLGAVYRDRVYQAGTARIQTGTPERTVSIPFSFKSPPILILDAGVNYRLNDQWLASLLIENIEDDHYSSTVTSNRDVLGAPRSALLRLAWTPLADRAGPRSRAGDAPFGKASNWYGGFDVGYHALGDIQATAWGRKADGSAIDWTFETQDGPQFNLLLGYRLNDHVRAEVEGGVRRSSFGRIAGEGAAPNGVCGVTSVSNGLPFTCNDAQGDADDWSLMANAIYDFGGKDWRLRPFLGGGVGVSRSSIDFSGKMKGVGSDDIEAFCTTRAADGRCTRASVPNSVYIGGDDQFMTAAYQLLGGLSWRLTDRLSLDATYRYYVAPDVKFSSWNLDRPSPANAPFFSRVGAFKGDYEDHSFTFGLRWNFG